MKVRVALKSDINQIQIVRNSVKENTLSNPDLIPNQMVEEYLLERGRGWVCELDDQIIGFSIVDLKDNNVWALFVSPDFDKRGVGRILHDTMLDWYFSKSVATIWLGTSPGTRAETFYRKSGWVEVGMHGNEEIKFEMTLENWNGK